MSETITITADNYFKITKKPTLEGIGSGILNTGASIIALPTILRRKAENRIRDTIKATQTTGKKSLEILAKERSNFTTTLTGSSIILYIIGKNAYESGIDKICEQWTEGVPGFFGIVNNTITKYDLPTLQESYGRLLDKYDFGCEMLVAPMTISLSFEAGRFGYKKIKEYKQLKKQHKQTT